MAATSATIGSIKFMLKPVPGLFRSSMSPVDLASDPLGSRSGDLQDVSIYTKRGSRSLSIVRFFRKANRRIIGYRALDPQGYSAVEIDTAGAPQTRRRATREITCLDTLP